MALFANGTKKVKSKKVKSAQPRRSRFVNQGVETVVEVKTVGDIPPVLEARKMIGEGDIDLAAKILFKAARDDYTRYFSTSGSSNGNRHFFISEISSLKVALPEMAYVDNTTIKESLNRIEINPSDQRMENRVNALKKLASFYLDFYEKARFSKNYDFDGDGLVGRFSEIYNYMDIMALYFPSHSEGRV